MMRIQWNEHRRTEMIFVIAEETNSGWEFFDRSSWETTWIKRNPTPDIVLQANLFAKASQRSEQNGQPPLNSQKDSVNGGLGNSIKCRHLSNAVVSQQKSRVPTKSSNLWIVGSFYLFATGVFVCLGILVAKSAYQMALPVILIFTALSTVVLGTFLLRHIGRLTEGKFVRIVLDSLRSLFLLKK